MKILILSQWFDPEPTFKGLLFARELAARGHEVEVLTGFPNYPGGKLYPGYKVKRWQREVMGGIPVLRVALYPSHDQSAKRRIYNYASFALSAAVFGTLLVKQPDVVYVYHPPATIGLAAVALRVFRGVPFVYDVQDLWPDTLAATGMLNNRRVLGLVDLWCQWIYRQASHIAVLSPGFRTRLIERGVPSEKISVIYNWCDEHAMQTQEMADSLSAPGKFCILFAGNMGRAQGLEQVLEAAKLCESTVPEAEFVFIGGGLERDNLIALSEQMALKNVRFLPKQPPSAMGPILAGADVLLVHLVDDPLFRITIPSKTQAYLAAGKPILMAVQGDAADLVLASGGGMVCEPGKPESIAEAVRQMAALSSAEREAMGTRGREFYSRELSVHAGVTAFEHVLEHAAFSRDANRLMTDPGKEPQL